MSIYSYLLTPTKSRMKTFWYQLTQVNLEKWPLKWRESFNWFDSTVNFIVP